MHRRKLEEVTVSLTDPRAFKTLLIYYDVEDFNHASPLDSGK